MLNYTKTRCMCAVYTVRHAVWSLHIIVNWHVTEIDCYLEHQIMSPYTKKKKLKLLGFKCSDMYCGVWIYIHICTCCYKCHIATSVLQVIACFHSERREVQRSSKDSKYTRGMDQGTRLCIFIPSLLYVIYTMRGWSKQATKQLLWFFCVTYPSWNDLKFNFAIETIL